MSSAESESSVTTSGREEAGREEEFLAAHVGVPPRLDSPIELYEADPDWPHAYERRAAVVTDALGGVVRAVEHVGSTSVPGLPAKPILDMVLAVPDAADEEAYVPALESVGYTLEIREPDWYEHRVLRLPHRRPAVNLHVFTAGCPEIRRMLRFRDWLREHDEDRDLYAATKRELAARTWKYTQHYADAKNGVIDEILARAGWSGGRS